MAGRCARCDVDGEDVRLFDAVYNGRMGKICERCSIIENIPIIKRPDSSQLKESEKGVGVYERVKRMAGIMDSKKEKTFFIEDRLMELNKKPELELPEKQKLNLIDYFHWEIMKNRRRKGLSHKQLAEILGESEMVIAMVEKGQVPENAESLIRKLEQFFQIRLRRFSEMEKIMKEKIREPILLDEEGKELFAIPEPEQISGIEIDRGDLRKSGLEDFEVVEIKDGFYNEEPSRIDKKELEESKDLDIDKINLSKVTIKDLRALHRKKIEATRQEKIEEQKKIEERQRIIEARKEELRMKKEKESRELDKILGGAELLAADNNSEDLV